MVVIDTGDGMMVMRLDGLTMECCFAIFILVWLVVYMHCTYIYLYTTLHSCGIASVVIINIMDLSIPILDGASLTQVAFLLSEASLLCGVVHINIHSPIGANTELAGPPQIAYPYPTKGNLKR